ncbi:O-antigen ligase family protein [Lapidilactobacillus bayanensis]|uniref:O-antigen ligase family protein n=1 Tax=Lapidilactobacillus bayanensis TaxID=2485998 RepID=UPI000F77AF55|nr:O-antigen ligase family protein [Lapidilactobacillus bayanensis]
MEKLVSYNKMLNRVFLLTYEVALLARMVILYSLIDSRFDTVLFSAITGLGAITFLSNVTVWVKQKKIPNIWLILFTLAMIVSSLLNGSKNLFGNFRLIAWEGILFFIVFYSASKNDEKLVRYFENIFFVFSGVTIFISLLMFITKLGYVAPLAKIYYGFRLGFVENRLYGVFVEPNFAANMSPIVILLSLKRLINGHLSRHQRVSLEILMLLNFFYIVLSGSRTVLVESVVIVMIGMFFVSFSRFQSIRLIKRWSVSLLIGLVGVTIFAGAYYGFKSVAPYLSLPDNISLSRFKGSSNDGTMDNNGDEDISLKREDVSNQADASNGRIRLWKSAIEIFQSSPIYGTSPRNLVNYAEKNLPNTRIAHSKQTPHNFLLFTLAGTGLIGIIPLLIFLITEFFGVIYALFKNDNIANVTYLLYALIAVSSVIFGLLMPDIIFENRIGALCFWLYLGTASYQKQFIGKEINNHAKAKLTGSTRQEH